MPRALVVAITTVALITIAPAPISAGSPRVLFNPHARIDNTQIVNRH